MFKHDGIPLTIVDFLRTCFVEPIGLAAYRLACLKHFLLLFIDVPAFICTIIVTITVWRAPLLSRDMGWTVAPWRHDEPSAALSSSSWHWHQMAFTHAAHLLYEFPFVIMLPLSAWRLPLMWRATLRARTVLLSHKYITFVYHYTCAL